MTAALSDLTARQRELLPLVVEGLTNEQIARRLFRTTKTIENHLSRLRRRLGVRNRVQLAVMAVREMQKGERNDT